jgi:hypothetical protein
VTKKPKLPLNNFAGKAKGAFGNSIGDRQMLEYAKAGDGAPVLHDDAGCESQNIYLFP